jgi:hypothetical protein
VLHQAATFHDRYLSDSITNLYTHLVPTDRTTITFTAFATLDDFGIHLWSAQRWTTAGTRLSSATATTLLIARGFPI